MQDVIVIGAGIVGSTIAEAFRQIQHREVLVLDDGRPLSGTWPCGGSVKPSPLTGLTSEQLKPSLDMLERLWTLTKDRYIVKPSGELLKMDVYRIDMDRVFGIEVCDAKVNQIIPGTIYPEVDWTELDGDNHITACKLLIVAAGMGCSELLPSIFPNGSITAKKGVSFQFEGSIDQPFVQTWAPYKQITIHNITTEGQPRTWASDGTAVKPESWDITRTAACEQRVMNALGTREFPIETRVGYRSFHSSKTKPCLLQEVKPNIWVATGAGKFGCIASGWAASQLLS